MKTDFSLAHNVTIICVRWGFKPLNLTLKTKLDMNENVDLKNETPTDANNVLGVVLSSDLDKVCEISDITTKGFYVYKGLPKEKDGKKLFYIGTTIQIPADRFRWHKANGKDFRFEIIKICKDENEMLDTEFALIKKYSPRYNKITNRKQNFNKKLSDEEKYGRVGNKEWCQCCLTRRVNKGYEFCYYCG